LSIIDKSRYFNDEYVENSVARGTPTFNMINVNKRLHLLDIPGFEREGDVQDNWDNK